MRDNGYQKLENWEKCGKAAYCHRFPDSEEKASYFFKNGMFLENEKAYDLRGTRVLCFWLACGGENTYRVTAKAALFRDGKPDDFETYTACAQAAAAGTYTLRIPAAHFDAPECAQYQMKFIRELRIEGEQPFLLNGAALLPDTAVAFDAEVLGNAGESGEEIVYRAFLRNCGEEPRTVSLVWKKYGNEVTGEIALPQRVRLGAFEEKSVKIRVPVAERIVPGGYEKQRILAIPDTDQTAAPHLTFYTAKKLRHPYLLLTEEEIAGVREKIAAHGWAAENYEACTRAEEKWQAPQITGRTPYLFLTSDSHHARKCAILYRLGAGEAYAEKAVRFLKELSDSEKGYPSNPRACSQELVHEGEFFKSAAFAYDLLYDRPEFSDRDRENIERTFRMFAGYIGEVLESGNVSNWALAELEGALYCAAVLQDMSLVHRFLYGVGGMTDILSRGVMSDGWWYEASIGYNLMAAGIFTEIAHVMLHLGMDLRYLTVPASYGERIDAGKVLQDGLIAENWGANDRNYRNIPMLWDSLVDAYDWNGVIFGLNDSAEMKIQGTSMQLMDSRYDLAYTLYKKEEYAKLLALCETGDRDLLFGAGELPACKESLRGKKSGFADSSGVCILRSQKEGVPDRMQLQAVLKYGSHGGAHGHYDRASMTSLRRCGRAITGPENIWYSYHTLMYKFFTQTSVNHNMVTVDYKMQEAVRPRRLLFYAGKLLQAAAVENLGRWSYPPYGGWQVNGDRTLKERTWNEGRYLPIPEEEPEYAVRTGFTEPVCTRRLTAVTDDFVVNFDFAQAENEHEFECLYHLRGFAGIEDFKGEPLAPKRRTEKLDDCMLGSAQLITDCSWYETDKGAVFTFEEEFGSAEAGRPEWLCRNRTGYNTPGIMHTRLYAFGGKPLTAAVGRDPEYQDVNKQLTYRVETDGETAAEGSFGAWILGRGEVEIILEGKRELTLCTRVRRVKFEEEYREMEKTVFWGDPVIFTEDGRQLFLSELPCKTENIDGGFGVGKDYRGGEVKLQGKRYEKAVPAEPLNEKNEGKITVSLEGLRAVRFCAAVGGDYPVGDERMHRRTVSLCQSGTAASWATLLETTEGEFLIDRVSAESAESLRVLMKDGREIRIRAEGLNDPKGEPSAEIEEWRDGVLIRSERTRRS